MSTANKEKPASCYELLEVPEGAGDDEIKRAYRRLAMQYHPDRWNVPDREVARLRFRAINEAYAQLKTSERRAAYNGALAAANARKANNSSFWGQIIEIMSPANSKSRH